MIRNLITALALSSTFAAGIASAAPLTAQPNDSKARADDTTTITADAPVNERYCLRHTGSHIYTSTHDRKEYKGCVNANGRVYTRDDIQRTGTDNVADALRKLDPSIH